MAESSQLERIESKLDKLCEQMSVVRQNQARDLERFTEIDRRFAETAETRHKEIRVSCLQCDLRESVRLVSANVATIFSRAQGAWWASGRIWAAIAALFMIGDIGVRIYQCLK